MQQLRTYFRQWQAARQARRVTYAEARRRAARGAAYLDEMSPEWYRQVNADTLELASGTSCVLGQLHGDFRAGLARERLLNMGSGPRPNLSPVAFGFQCVGGVSEALQARDYAHLNRAWQAAVRRRQVQDTSWPSGAAAQDASRPSLGRSARNNGTFEEMTLLQE